MSNTFIACTKFFSGFQIVFEGVMQLGSEGFIALDEVVVKDGSCPPPGSCDFEEDLCTWQNAESGVDLEWIKNSGPTPTNGTGPNVDQTLGTKEGEIRSLLNESVIFKIASQQV